MGSPLIIEKSNREFFFKVQVNLKWSSKNDLKKKIINLDWNMWSRKKSNREEEKENIS